MAKKIGCVIAYTKNHNNYGTSLQGYAMLKKIQQLGYDVEVINYIKRLTLKEKMAYVWNAFRVGDMSVISRRLISNGNKKDHPDYAKGLSLRTKAVNAYKDKKLTPLFKDYIGFDSLQKGSMDYDTIVVGSDQVWTPLSLPNKYYNLLFVDDSVPKVAYASSFGVSVIPDFQKKATGEYLDRFHVIGVREQRGKELVDALSHQTATVVADPTLLLSCEEWEEEINQHISETTQQNMERAEGAPYIFCYLISPNEEGRKQAKLLSEKTGLPIITIRHMEQYREIDETIGDEAPYSVDPNDFIRYISKARYVCTDSFHCTVFSTLFHKQFMTFYRSKSSEKNSKNSRIDSLFSVLGINKEHIYAGDMSKIDAPVDWQAVDRNLANLRADSIEFLNNALK